MQTRCTHQEGRSIDRYREQLVERVAADRRAGLTIAFANGCFDLLHVGHVRYLQAAAAEADRLVVAVNDDGMAAGKGPGRPIMTAVDRAALVAALRGVDYVVIFPGADRDAAPHARQARRPLQGHRLHCRYGPERDTVRAYGGRIAIVGDPKDHSTRDLLARILGDRQ